MKAAKPLITLLFLALLGGVAYLLFATARPAEITLTNGTAAPLSRAFGTVAVFVGIDNPGPADRLISAASPVAKSARLRGAPLAIPAGSSPALAADGAYVHLTGVSGDIKDGQLIPVTLRFEQAGEQTFQARLIAPRETGSAPDFGLFGIGDICLVGDGEPAPAISLQVTPESGGFRVDVDAREFSFEKDMADGPHVPGTGHGHLYLNGLKLQRLYDNTALIGALPVGRHQITVTLNTNDHRAYVVGETPVTASAEIEVH